MKAPGVVQSAIGAVIEGRSAHSLESSVLDFKQADRDPRKVLTVLAEAATCFANASGGHLVVGIANRPGGITALKGCATSVTDVRKGIFERTNPGLVVDVDEYRHADAPAVRLLIVTVPQGTQVYSVAGRVTMRMGTDCKALSPAEVHRLYIARLNLDLTAEPTRLDISAVSASAVEIARRRLRAMPEAGREIAGLPLAEMLRNLKLVDDTGRLRRAGALLFTTPTDATDASVVYVHRQQASGEPDFSTRLTGTILEVAEQTIDLVRARRHERNLLLPNGQQITVADFPDPAVREAIANALVHRDYRIDGSVFVDHNNEHLTVTSPGGFVTGVTPDNVLTGEPRARNPLLAEAARSLRLGERLGIGVDRMYRSMIAAGGNPPNFDDHDDAVRVHLAAARDTDIAKFVAQLPTSINDEHETDVLLVIHELCRQRTINADTLMPIAQRPRDDAQAVLRRMAHPPLELLEPTRRTANRTYPTYRLRDLVLAQLAGAVHYHRRTGDDIDRKILTHVAEYQHITNATVRNILDVSVTRASGILRDLVDRQLLTKTSTQQRGSAVNYGPGPHFPPQPPPPAKNPPARRQPPTRRGDDRSRRDTSKRAKHRGPPDR